MEQVLKYFFIDPESCAKNAHDLIENGFDIHEKEKVSGIELLKLAFVYQTPEFFEYLINKNVDVNLQGRQYGYTILMHVCYYSNLNLNNALRSIKLLLKNNADANLQNNDGETALMHLMRSLCQSDEWYNIFLILVGCSDTSIKDVRQRTAYDIYMEKSASKSILGDRELSLLCGKTKLNNTKSAGKIN